MKSIYGVILFFLSLSILCSPYSDYYKSNYIIAVNPITPLHKLSKDSIFSLRTARVKEHKLLGIFPKKYIPCASIYGRIDKNCDWVHDTQFYICNPYLLALVSSSTRISAFLPHCGITSVEYSYGKITETYRGLSAEKWLYYAFDYYPDSSQYRGVIRLWLVNALDAGFNYAHIDSSKSQNIAIAYPRSEGSILKSVYSERDLYHVGQYNKNNISPYNQNATIKLLKKEAKTALYVKLWRNCPSSPDIKEDFAYVIDIEP